MNERRTLYARGIFADVPDNRQVGTRPAIQQVSRRLPFTPPPGFVSSVVLVSTPAQEVIIPPDEIPPVDASTETTTNGNSSS